MVIPRTAKPRTSSVRAASEYAFDSGMGQVLPEHAEPLIQARLHGTERTVEEIGDLLERQAVVLLQDDCGALLFGQHRHGFGHRATELAARDEILDGLGRFGLRRELNEIDALGSLCDRRTPLAADPVPTEIERDPIQPGRELRLALEAAERAKGAEEGFLGDVTGVLFAADDAIL